jgi:hypothetical protein
MTREQYQQRLAALRSRYPNLFSGKRLEYDIAPGWLSIIDELCARIERTLTEEEKPTVHFLQIKEKFGGLRTYIVGAPMRIDIIGKSGLRLSGSLAKRARSDVFTRIAPFIEAAEAMSYRTCIFCGAPGRVRRDRDWFLTLCDKHERCSYLELQGRFEELTTA